jgi:hypothetical protein
MLIRNERTAVVSFRRGDCVERDAALTPHALDFVEEVIDQCFRILERIGATRIRFRSMPVIRGFQVFLEPSGDTECQLIRLVPRGSNSEG